MNKSTFEKKEISDLRSALAIAEEHGELVRIKKPVDVKLELVGEYLKHAGGTPVPQPTRIGPAVLFENVLRTVNSEAIPYEIPVVAGVVGSRRRAALYFNVPEKKLALKMLQAMRNPVAPRLVRNAPCQEVVIDRNINLTAQLPIPTMSYDCAGPTITMGLMLGVDPETGQRDVTFHRIFVVGPDTITALMGPIRHIKQMQLKAEAKGEPFPVTINIGIDPFSAISAGISSPTGTDLDELAVAGALKGSPIELVKCKTINCEAIANAEIVLEAEIQPHETIMEDAVSNRKGWSMPEMAGYVGGAAPAQVIKVKAITHRIKPIYQTLVTPGEEHNVIMGVPGEAEILNAVWKAGYQDLLADVYLLPAGGGKLFGALQVRKKSMNDDLEVRNLALLALATRLEMRHVIIVDEDVDIRDPMDLWWAFTTRFNPKEDLVTIDQSKTWPGLAEHIRITKAIFDCTVPWNEKEKMRRPRWKRD
ncbi:MAG: UbiD family decarboxylase [Candidatus Bathyarchaeia archaeon]